MASSGSLKSMALYPLHITYYRILLYYRRMPLISLRHLFGWLSRSGGVLSQRHIHGWGIWACVRRCLSILKEVIGLHGRKKREVARELWNGYWILQETAGLILCWSLPFTGWLQFTSLGYTLTRTRLLVVRSTVNVKICQGRPKAPFDIIQKITFNCWNLAQFFCSSLNYCLV